MHLIDQQLNLMIRGRFDEEIKNKWIIYRQGLRDITNIYLQNDTIDISQVNWPQIPQK